MATLDELRGARDKLLTGKRVASITSGGRTVQYVAADLADIERRIRELEKQEGARPVSTVHVRPRKGW
jgi:hypothetical protein